MQMLAVNSVHNIRTGYVSSVSSFLDTCPVWFHSFNYSQDISIADTPADVVRRCGTTYCMLSNLEASQAVFDAPETGVIAGVSAGKVIVDCATLSPERMMEEEQAITSRGGRFLEAPVSGSKVCSGLSAKWRFCWERHWDARMNQMTSYSQVWWLIYILWLNLFW